MSAVATSAMDRRRVNAVERALSDKAVKSYFDPEFNARAIKIFPGEHHVTDAEDTMLVTVLGSCVSACIRDRLLKIGGMNHFMLPASSDGIWGKASAAMRYGNFAMEQLINDILRKGGHRSRLEIKVFGGGNVLAGMTTIGSQNAAFVESYLAAEGLPIAAQHLRGDHPRRVHYFPSSGRVMVRELRRESDLAALEMEKSYQSKISAEPQSGDVELFD